MKKTWFVMLLVLLSSMAVQAAGSNNENYLTADPIEVVSINGALRLERLELPITMVNSVSIAGFQCDIMFPNGIAPINNEGQYEVALSSRVNDDYKVEVRKLSNGALRLLVYTFTASSIVGNDGVSLGVPYSVVRFSSGKFYNADLNAAYNIGARYYIRLLLDFLKARLSSEDFGALLAKVPRCSARSKCVLSDLIDLWRVACS